VGAERKCRFSEVANAVGDGDAGKADAAAEGRDRDTRHAVADGDVRQIAAPKNDPSAEAGDAVRNCGRGQARGVTERIEPDVRDAARNRVASRFASRVSDERGLAFVVAAGVLP